VRALRGVFGDEDALNAATAARSDAVENLYRMADESVISPMAIAPQTADKFASALSTPAGQEALRRARVIAANEGRAIFEGDSLTGWGLQVIKKQFDDIAAEAANKVSPGKSSAFAGSVENVQNRLIEAGEEALPVWAQAKNVFASMSAPVNQMKTGQRLIDAASGTTPMPVKVGGVVVDEQNALLQSGLDKIARSPARQKAFTAQTLGKQYAKTFDELFTPEQMSTLDSVRKDIARSAGTAARGKAPGSDTRNNILTEQFISELRGSLGPLEKIDAIKGFLGVAAGAATKIASGTNADQALDMAIKNMLLDPKEFARIVRSNPALGAKISQALGDVGAGLSVSGATAQAAGLRPE
jgi:hypothetical protein